MSLMEAEDNNREEMIMTWVMALAAVSFNIFAAKHLPLFEGVILFFNIIGFFAVCIPLWVLAPKAPSSEVWGKFYNGGGWSSTGVAAVVGILAPSGAFIGADSTAHMSVRYLNVFPTDSIQY
jgi:choline transport protein